MDNEVLDISHLTFALLNLKYSLLGGKIFWLLQMLWGNILFRKHFIRWECFRLYIRETLSKIGCKWMGTKRQLFPVASHHQITLYFMQTMINVKSIFLQLGNSHVRNCLSSNLQKLTQIMFFFQGIIKNNFLQSRLHW